MWKLWKEQQTSPGLTDTKTEGAHVSPSVQWPFERNASREFTVNIRSISDEEGGSVRKVRSCGKEYNEWFWSEKTGDREKCLWVLRKGTSSLADSINREHI